MSRHVHPLAALVLLAVSCSKRATTLFATFGTLTAFPAGVLLYFACARGWMGLPEIASAGFPEWTGWVIVPGFFLAAGCPILLALLRLLPEQAESPEADQLVWKNPLEALRGDSWPGIGDYRVLTAILIAVMIWLYWVFS